MTSHDDTFVITRADDGFRVYHPAEPAKSYQVGGGPDAPTCTCPDFQYGPVGAACAHIQAVLAQLGAVRAGTPPSEDAERRAIQAEDAAPEPPCATAAAMLLKRSVSPDGRIDSLSVEFTCPVDGCVFRAMPITIPG